MAWESGSLLNGLKGLLPWRKERAANGAPGSQEAAKDMLASLRKAAHPQLPLVLLDELPELTPADVEKWTESLPNRYDRQKIVAQVMTGAPDSAAVFEKMAALFANDRRDDA